MFKYNLKYILMSILKSGTILLFKEKNCQELFPLVYHNKPKNYFERNPKRIKPTGFYIIKSFSQKR